VTEKTAFRAKDVKEMADLSYRQINDWDQKGAIPDTREDKPGWRNFTPREVFCVLVCAEMRKRFGVPLESLRFLQSCMLRDKANHLSAAVEIIATIGAPVFIVTDFKGFFVMDHTLEISDYFLYGLIGREATGPCVVLEVNPLVNKILESLNPPRKLDYNWEKYRFLLEARNLGNARNPSEYEILQMVRNKTFSKIEIRMQDGTIKHLEAEAEHGPAEVQEVLDLLNSNSYLTISITKHDGQIVRLNSKHPRKVAKG